MPTSGGQGRASQPPTVSWAFMETQCTGIINAALDAEKCVAFFPVARPAINGKRGHEAIFFSVQLAIL